MKAQKGRKVAALNVLGSLGYLACLFQWLWAAVILLPSVINSSLYKYWFPRSVTSPEPTIVQASTPSGPVPEFISVIAIVIGCLIIFGALYVIVIKMPKSVAKTGEKVTHTVATVIAPVVIEHIHLPAKQRRQVPDTVIIIMKLLLVFLPLGTLLFAENLTLAMSFEIIMFIGITLFSWSFVLFALQFVLSRLLNVGYESIR